MKISSEWLRDYVQIPQDLPVEDLAHELTLKTVEVEGLENTATSLEDVVVARISRISGDRNRTSVQVEAGQDSRLEADADGFTLKIGELVAVALDRNSANSGIAPAMSARICSPRDLGLQGMYPDSRDEALRLHGARPGSALAPILHLNDTVLEIDNKSLTNRPDLWGHYGIAREVAAIYDLPLKQLAKAPWPTTRLGGLIDEIDPSTCRRFAALYLRVDQTTRSPLWLRSRLARVGQASINLPVDLSNYVMYVTGQPTHVYDAHRITLPLSTKRVGSDRKLRVVGGDVAALDPQIAVVTDAHRPIAVAGVIGGEDSAVSTQSRQFVIEAASFRPMPIRSSSQRLGLRTEASARFEKNIDTQRVDEAVQHLLWHIADLMPGAVVEGADDVTLEPTRTLPIDVPLRFLDQRIGEQLDPHEMRRTLTALGFDVSESDGAIHVVPPVWRSTGDVGTQYDILEEVARLHGYDNFGAAELKISLAPPSSLNRIPIDRRLREELAARGAMREVVTYPWVSDDMLAATGLSKIDTVIFEGAPAPDRNSLRPSLVPNLLEAVANNLRFFREFSIFELGSVFRKGATNDDVPSKPVLMLAGAMVAMREDADGASLFLRAKGIIEMLRRRANLVELDFTDAAEVSWADPGKQIGLRANGQVIGAVGLASSTARQAREIDVEVACFELLVAGLSAHATRHYEYSPLPPFPDAMFDLSVVVADGVAWKSISAVAAEASPLINAVEYAGEFRGSWVPTGSRAVTMRVVLRSSVGTLTARDIAGSRQLVLDALQHEVGARLREAVDSGPL